MEGEDNWDMSRHGFINQRTAKAHLKKVADIITRANPDIVVMQEVGGCGALTEVRDNLGADIKSKYNPYVIANFDTNKQHVGILTRLDPIDIGVDRDASRLKASYFEFHVKQLKRRNSLKLYGIHLIGGMNKNLRERQTNALKDWIRTDHNNLDPYVIVMGDFNDWDFYKVPKRFLYVGDNIETINQNLNKVMTDVSGLGTIKSKAVDKIRQSRSPVNMINAMYFAEKWQRKTNMAWTPRAIDHIMMTEELAEFITNIEFNTDITKKETSSPQEHGYIMITLDLTRYKDVCMNERNIVYDYDTKVLKSMLKDEIDRTYFIPAIKKVEKEIKTDIKKLKAIQNEGTVEEYYAQLSREREDELHILMKQKSSLIDPHYNQLSVLKKILKILTDNDWENVPTDDKKMFKEQTKLLGIWRGTYRFTVTKTKYNGKKGKHRRITKPAVKEDRSTDFPPIKKLLQKSTSVCEKLITKKNEFIETIPDSYKYIQLAEKIEKAAGKLDEAKALHKKHQSTKEQLLKLFMTDEKSIKISITDNDKLLTKLEKYQQRYTEIDPIPHLFAKTNDKEYGLNLDVSNDAGVFNSNIDMDTFVMQILFVLLIFGALFCCCGALGFLVGFFASWIFKKQ
eukprot:13585_1